MLEILAYESGLLSDFIKWEGESYERHFSPNRGHEVMMNENISHYTASNMSGVQNLASDHLVLFCGSFNPIHIAHKEIIDKAEDILGHRVALEISVKNVDKAGLDYFDIKSRSEALQEYPLVFTNTPLIMDKIRLFKKERPYRKLTFVMGKDTWDRFLNPKYDQNIPSLVTELAWNNKMSGVSFLVFGRDGSPFNPHHPAEQFRIQNSEAERFTSNISSREIRAGQAGKL
jgi:nicotinic acid mononucleotide adenylyltransferase